MNEGGILRQEPEPRVNRLAAGRLGSRDHVGDSEVAVRRGGRPDAHGSIGEPYVHRLTVGGRVDGDRLHVELVERPDDAHRDLTPVRDEDAREHRQTIG